ncbi:MAG: glutamate racemase [Verrucomicrobia bacterium]|nr:glutamate racemase [Verrucomicrobiota bacterium]
MRASDLPIGIFDSGIGGLTVVRQIRRALPHEDLVYLGDTARVPYGTKSPGTVVRFACEDTQFLLDQKVKAVVVACNTASAWALPTLDRRFEAVPIFGVIAPGARAALARTRNRRIGVIATLATVRSQAYAKALLARDDCIDLVMRDCPLLVPLVEEGWTSGPITESVLRQYLAPLLAHGIDTLVLGCTHYPLLREAIATVAGAGVALVDSAESCAEYVAEGLRQMGLLTVDRKRAGRIQPFVTDDPRWFDELAGVFLGEPADPSSQATLPIIELK